MILASAAVAFALLAMLPPPVQPDTGVPSTPLRPPSTEPAPDDENAPPDPAFLTLLPDDGSPWGLAPELGLRLAAVADKYLKYAVKFTCSETVRKAKFDDGEAKNPP